MSELINNREHRKAVIKEIILDLHKGKSVPEVKARFDQVAKDMEAAELSLIEQSLINEGLPIEEVQRLCDVHAAVFKEALADKPDIDIDAGHPLDIYRDENEALEKLIKEEIQPLINELKTGNATPEQDLILKLREKLNLLWDVDKHYSRKENLIFPFLERYGITGPPKVMWGADDEVRALLKEAKQLAGNYTVSSKEELISKLEAALYQMEEMIFKESKILFPMLLETLSEDDWIQIYEDSDQIGYCLIEPELNWQPARQAIGAAGPIVTDAHNKGYIKLDTGVLTAKELQLIFSHLPVDITFVDKAGIVKFFSATKDRIFHRTKTILGRKVENCHPPASVHIVEQIVDELQSGDKDSESFWIQLGEKYVYIQYFAVRDENNAFIGVLEVTQDIKPLQAITGEKRIMD